MAPEFPDWLLPALFGAAAAAAFLHLRGRGRARLLRVRQMPLILPARSRAPQIPDPARHLSE